MSERSRREEPPRGWLKTLLFAAGIALVFGTLVSTVATWLAPRQALNERRYREAVLESLLACQPELVEQLALDGGEGSARIDPRVVDLDTGCYVPGADAACFDVEEAAADPRRRRTLAPEEDLAGIRFRANRAVVYEARREGELLLLVLPVHGMGYAGRMEAFLSLEADLDTVSSLVFYAHEETPGMGARVADPAWQAAWRGKRLRDETGRLRIGVRARAGGGASAYEIDAMSGATRTGRGVTNLLHFWLGEQGYAPLLRNLGSGAACVRGAR